MGIWRRIKPRSWLWLCNGGASHLRVAAVVIIAALLPGCAASQFANLPSQMGGEAAGTPSAPASPPAFPAVHDMPPARPAPILTEDQQRQAEAELVAARDRARPPPKKPAAQSQPQKKQQTAAQQVPAKPAPTEQAPAEGSGQ